MVKIFYSVTSTTVVDTPLTFENPETTLSIQLLDGIYKATKGLTWYRSPASQCFAISDTLFSFELLWNKFTWPFQSEWLKWAEELFLSELVWPWKRHSFDLLIFRTVLELALHEELPVQCIFPVFCIFLLTSLANSSLSFCNEVAQYLIQYVLSSIQLFDLKR